MKKALIFLIRAYQRLLSPDKGIFGRKRLPTCVFFPTCSEYAIQALEKYGVLKGILLAFRRVLRCHPWQKEHIDLVK